MSEAPRPDPVAEEPTPPVSATVTIIAPIWEAGRNYHPGELLEVSESRAQRLVELALAAWPPDPCQPRSWWTRWRERKPANGRRDTHARS
jgi:hypothetical protein